MVDKQIEMLKNALAKTGGAGARRAGQQGRRRLCWSTRTTKKLPVIAFDSGVDSVIPRTTATTDNVAAAGLAADKMAELIGKSGEVAIVMHDDHSRTGIDRRDGFVKRMKGYRDIKIVSVQYGGGDKAEVGRDPKAILEQYPEIKGIFGANEGSAIGVLNAVKEMQKKIVIIGYDSGKEQKAAVASGNGRRHLAEPGRHGLTVEAAVKAIKGEQLPKLSTPASTGGTRTT